VDCTQNWVMAEQMVLRLGDCSTKISSALTLIQLP
jgi:hypothetical protein